MRCADVTDGEWTIATEHREKGNALTYTPRKMSSRVHCSSLKLLLAYRCAGGWCLLSSWRPPSRACPPYVAAFTGWIAPACGWRTHSITSSTSASNLSGTFRPSVLAVLRLMSNSNLVGCTTGRSDGTAPLRIVPT
jgi:hypothetical protein